MGGAIRLRQDFGADELRRFAAKAKDGAQARRLLALAAVHDGMNRSEAARIGGMDRQTLRDSVHRFNQHGPEGLIDIKPPGRPSKLSAEQKEALKQLRRDRSRRGDGRRRALALRRSEACSGAALRRRSVGSELGAGSEEARLLTHQRPAKTPGPEY
jgi:transposase